MIHVAICDDEQQILRMVEEETERFFRTSCVECEIQSYLNSDNLRYDLQDDIKYDLFLLDIEMPGVNGMDLAKEIQELLPSAKMIFITSHLEYAITAYEYAIFRYIPKDTIHTKLSKALSDFYKLYDLERSEYYTIAVKNHVEQISYRDILYIMKEGKYSIFHLKHGKTASVRKSLAQVFSEIGQTYFYFADRGCILNLANVTGIKDEDVIMADGKSVSISKGNLTELKSVVLKFWEKQI